MHSVKATCSRQTGSVTTSSDCRSCTDIEHSEGESDGEKVWVRTRASAGNLYNGLPHGLVQPPTLYVLQQKHLLDLQPTVNIERKDDSYIVAVENIC